MTKPKIGTIAINHPREKKLVEIVADGAIGNALFTEGRMMPLVILDTRTRPDIDEYIRLHEFEATGEVATRWTMPLDRKDTVALYLRFTHPSEIVVQIAFDLTQQHGVLIEQILATRALYIQAGRPGDRLKNDIHRPKVIVEVPDTGFMEMWDDLYRRFLVTKLRAEGRSRPDAKRISRSMIDALRQHSKLRLPMPAPTATDKGAR